MVWRNHRHRQMFYVFSMVRVSRLTCQTSGKDLPRPLANAILECVNATSMSRPMTFAPTQSGRYSRLLLLCLLCLFAVQLVAETWIVESIAMPAACEAVGTADDASSLLKGTPCSLLEDDDDPGDTTHHGWPSGTLTTRAKSRFHTASPSSLPSDLFRPPAALR